MNTEDERGAALMSYLEKYGEGVKPKESVEFYEYCLLFKGYQFLKEENGRLKEKLKKLKVSP